MLEVAGRPFIAHQLALLRENGVRRVVVCVGHLGQQIEAYLGDGAAHGMEVRYSYDGERLLGTGGALRRALPLLGDVFWVMYGDSYTDFDYRAVLTDFERQGALALMTVLRNANAWDRSNALFREGRLVHYDKFAPTPDMAHIDYGVALLRRAAVERVPPDRPSDLASLYQALVAEGAMSGYEVSRRFYEIGSAAGLAETRQFLAARRGVRTGAAPGSD
jgi:NDP-sugar pyrophosphorylase family protein